MTDEHEDKIRVAWTDPITGTESEVWLTLEEAAALKRGESVAWRGKEVQRWTPADEIARLNAELEGLKIEQRLIVYRARREKAREEGLLDWYNSLPGDQREELRREYPWLEEEDDDLE